MFVSDDISIHRPEAVSVSRWAKAHLFVSSSKSTSFRRHENVAMPRWIKTHLFVSSSESTSLQSQENVPISQWATAIFAYPHLKVPAYSDTRMYQYLNGRRPCFNVLIPRYQIAETRRRISVPVAQNQYSISSSNGGSVESEEDTAVS
jgi:hypothetical protein